MRTRNSQTTVHLNDGVTNASTHAVATNTHHTPQTIQHFCFSFNRTRQRTIQRSGNGRSNFPSHTAAPPAHTRRGGTDTGKDTVPTRDNQERRPTTHTDTPTKNTHNLSREKTATRVVDHNTEASAHNPCIQKKTPTKPSPADPTDRDVPARATPPARRTHRQHQTAVSGQAHVTAAPTPRGARRTHRQQQAAGSRHGEQAASNASRRQRDRDRTQQLVEAAGLASSEVSHRGTPVPRRRLQRLQQTRGRRRVAGREQAARRPDGAHQRQRRLRDANVQRRDARRQLPHQRRVQARRQHVRAVPGQRREARLE